MQESGIDAIRLAQELIRIETCQDDRGVVRALELLGQFAGQAGASWEVLHHRGAPAGLVARWGRRGSPRLALCGHIDTVPADEAAWTRPPLSGVVERGRLHGRGACDMKGALAAMAIALRDVAALKHDALDDVALVITTAEEVDSSGASALLSMGALDGVSEMLIGEPTRLDVGVGHKGALWVSLTTSGVPAHSSQPEQGRNAILEMLDCITPYGELERRLTGGVDDPVLGRPTVSLNIVRGGVARNVVPAECSVELDIRTVTGMHHKELIAGLERSSHGAAIEVIRDAPSVVASATDGFVERARQAVERALGQAPRLRSLPYVTDASVLGPLEAVTVFLGPGDERLAHTEDEYVEVQDVYRAVQCYMELLLDERPG
ncbi:MAG: M20 family metallopeptidase [Gaiellales bacterium]